MNAIGRCLAAAAFLALIAYRAVAEVPADLDSVLARAMKGF